MPKRILCVDDNADTCTLLTTMLGLTGLEAASVATVDGALRMMGRERFGLYAIDSQLPGVSGFTLCERIREADRETPIIIFSAHGYQSDIDAGLLAGANVYIVKPHTDEFVPAVKRLLEGARPTA